MEMQICFREQRDRSGNMKSFRIIEQCRNEQEEFKITPKDIEVIYWEKIVWYTNFKRMYINILLKLKKIFGYKSGDFKVKSRRQ